MKTDEEKGIPSVWGIISWAADLDWVKKETMRSTNRHSFIPLLPDCGGSVPGCLERLPPCLLCHGELYKPSAVSLKKPLLVLPGILSAQRGKWVNTMVSITSVTEFGLFKLQCIKTNKVCIFSVNEFCSAWSFEFISAVTFTRVLFFFIHKHSIA